MNLELIASVGIFGLGIVWYLIKVLVMHRIEKLEKRSQSCLSEQEARRLLADKIEPMKEDLQEIKVQLNKLFDKLLK